MKIKSPMLYFGWWIVGASFIILLYTNSIIVYGFTAIFEPVISELGWSHTQVSFAASLRGLEEGFFILVIGVFVDRWGPRKFLFGGAILTALGYFMLSNISSLTGFYVAYIIVGLGRSFVSNTVLMTSIANWFRSKAGKASAIALSGSMFGGLSAPVIVKIVDSYGWREATTIFAVGLLAIVLPLSFIFRHKPETYGYSVDGLKEKALGSKQIIKDLEIAEPNVTFKQAISGRAFWQITLGYICLFTIYLGFLAHILPYLGSIGIARSTTSFLAILISVFGIASRIGFGFAMDKFNKQLTSSAPFIFLIFGMLIMSYASSTSTALVITGLILFGSSWGCNAVLRVAMIRELFGRKKFGSIMGLMTGISIIVAMVGPPFAGWVFDNQQSYQNAWLIFTGLAVAGTISIITVPGRTRRNT